MINHYKELFFGIIGEYTPKLSQIIKILLKRKNIFKPMNMKFIEIFSNNEWGCEESISGSGSSVAETIVIRRKLPILLKKISARSLLDISCGDFNWMSKVDLNFLDEYLGGDIVLDIITQNKKKYEKGIIKFKLVDMTKTKLPKMDVILCRDCFIHFSYKDIFAALRNFKKSKSKYLLTTTFINRQKNRNIFTGGWRTINLQKPPFNFPKPNKLILESFNLAKCLGLWKMEDINA